MRQAITQEQEAEDEKYTGGKSVVMRWQTPLFRAGAEQKSLC